MLRSIINTSIIALGAKSVGLSVPLVFAYMYGVNEAADAFFYTYTIVLVSIMVVSPVVENVFVPYFHVPREQLPCVFSAMTLMVAVIYAFVALLLYLAAIYVVPVVTGFSDSVLGIVQGFLLVILPFGILLLINSVYTALLISFGDFDMSVASPIARSSTMLASVVFFAENFGAMSLAIGLVVGELIRFVLLSMYVFWKGYKVHSLESCSRNNERFSFVQPMIVQFSGTSLVAINPFINKTIASFSAVGGVSLIEYAEKFYLVAITVMTAGLMPVITSRWSKASALKEKTLKEIWGEAKNISLVAGLVSVLIALAVFVAFELLDDYIFSSLSGSDRESLKYILIAFLAGCAPYVSGSIFVRYFYSTKSGGVVAVLSAINVILTLLLGVVMFDAVGLWGVPAANSIVSAVMFVLLFWSSKRRLSCG